MKTSICTGKTCVGDLRLSALDVGFDLRKTGAAVRLPKNFTSVGLDVGGDTLLIEGTREELVREIVAAGYSISGQ